jgi:OmpA-OmpF porin, OOP family
MYKRVGLSALAAFGLIAATAAHADVQPGFYAGVGLGQSTIDVGLSDDSDTSFKVFGGYSFNENFAAELAYIDGGSVAERQGPTSVEVEATGLSAVAVGRLPVTDMFSVYAKAGIASYDVELQFSDPFLGNGSVKDSDEDLIYGIGAAFGFGQFELRGEYEMVDVSNGDFDLLTLSGLFRF